MTPEEEALLRIREAEESGALELKLTGLLLDRPRLIHWPDLGMCCE
jgi:hypothetical protein